MNTSCGFSVAYVITSVGSDIHADMALVSMLSVRLTNPSLPIVAVCDHLTVAAFQTNRPRFLDVCDEVVEVKTPDGEPIFRNRWIKTQLPRFVPGPCLFLDADTLVRAPLSQLPNLITEFGAAANHSAESIDVQIWEGDAKVIQTMGWTHKPDFYANGGVWFYKPCPGVDALFELWHSNWSKNIAVGNGYRDQPAFNHALFHSGVTLTRLPSEFNFQGTALAAWNSNECSKALIWHFYASAIMQDTVFGILLKRAASDSIPKLRRMVRRAIRRKSPNLRRILLRRNIYHTWRRIRGKLLSYLPNT